MDKIFIGTTCHVPLYYFELYTLPIYYCDVDYSTHSQSPILWGRNAWLLHIPTSTLEMSFCRIIPWWVLMLLC